MTTDVEYYRRLAGRAFAGRRFLLFGGVLAGLTDMIRELGELGARRPFALAVSPGLGPLPKPEVAHARIVPMQGEATAEAVEGIWAFEAAMRSLPPDVEAEIDAWDPEHSACALVPFTLSRVPAVAGRRRYADRPERWAELEDKTKLPGFLDAIGVRRGPLAIVRADPVCLRAAAARLDRGLGTVWAGDTRPGLHGGGFGVRWVHDDETRSQAEAFFPGRFERVRVMPFYEGIPCSIHGIVFPQGVAVFRPLEMLVLRRRGTSRFVYAGTASFWDPDPDEREEMRALAHQVGLGLRDRLGYRGAFTVDGVLSDAGFVPTELNARIGGAFRHLYERSPELPLDLLALAAQEGEPFDWRPAELERLVLERADLRRAGSARMNLPRQCAAARAFAVARRGARLVRASRPQRGAGRLWLGPTVGEGSFLVFAPDPERTAVGPSFAALAAEAFRLADRELGTGIGPLEPASPAGAPRDTMALQGEDPR
jgi:hypothetical protein